MTLTVIPDVEALVGDYLRSHADIVALGANVATRTPAKFTRPWVKITQLDDPTVNDSRSDHLIEYMLQLDCYAGSEGGTIEASLLSRTVRAALSEMPGVHDGVTVTGVRHVSAPRIPDTDFEPARERVARTEIVWVHA